MDLNQIALLITAIGAVALGMIVWQRTPDRVWNRLFAVHATGGGLWTLTNFLIMTANSSAMAEIWLRISHPVVAMVICTCVDFAWTFPERIEYAPRRRRMILYAIGVVLGTVAFAPNLVQGIAIQSGYIRIVNVTYGWPVLPFWLFTVAALAYADVVLLRKAFALRAVQRVQVIYVLLGLVGSHLVAILTIIIIPAVWGTTAWSGWGAGGYIITLAGMGYAIAKHRLMRPQAGLRRLASAVLASTAVLVIGLTALRALQLAGSPAFSSVPVLMAAGAVMGIGMVLLYTKIHGSLEVAAEKGADGHADGSATHILRTLDASELLDYLARTLFEHLGADSAVVFIRDDDAQLYEPRAWRTTNGNGPRPPLEPMSPSGPLVSTIAREATGSRAPTPLSLDQVRRFRSLDEARTLTR
ncbi:MAG TPA: histidine kinase N-terminal 7TM domain-containing protein, partial [Armatimonadota bacterium]|nr:histidine kinase N-terminal 7TM domain-containing protein [Armatimonadota bacterium]